MAQAYGYAYTAFGFRPSGNAVTTRHAHGTVGACSDGSTVYACG